VKQDLPQDLAEEERLVIDVIDAIASRSLSGACAVADETGWLDPTTLTILREQGLVQVEPQGDHDSDLTTRLDLLVVERLARVGAAAATLVAGHADCTAACPPGSGAWTPDAWFALVSGVPGSVTVRAASGRWILTGKVQRVELPEAAVMVVLARDGDGSEGVYHLTADDDVRISPPERTTGLRGLNVVSVALDECRITGDRRVAGDEAARAARTRRMTSSAALCVGIGAGAWAQAVAYSETRRQFGSALHDFPAIRQALTTMRTDVAAAAALLWNAARALEGPAAEAESAARDAATVAARVARATTRAAVQIHGGYGYVREQPVERFMRDAISAGARAAASDGR
jgi:alkylation response protein AidB-like acyl-CoA dehydrogenase